MSAVSLVAVLTLASVPTPQEPTAPPAATPSFADRVEAFWREWSRLDRKLHAIVGKQDSTDAVLEIVSPCVDRLLPGIAWNFTAGSKDSTHAFVLSPEGDLDRWLLTHYWLSKAPVIEGWEFFASTPPGSAKDFELRIDGKQFEPDGYRIRTVVDEPANSIDVSVWHPSFADVDEQTRSTVALLALHTALGEDMVQVWVGDIQVAGDAPTGDSCSLAQLAAQFRDQLRKQKWNADARRDELFSVYRHEPEVEPSFPRADLLAGTTIHPWLALDHLEAKGQLEDPLAGTGACYAWIAFPTDSLDRSKAAEQRGELEEQLGQHLTFGRVLGGAYGLRECCIDLLLYDRDRAIEEVKRAVADW